MEDKALHMEDYFVVTETCCVLGDRIFSNCKTIGNKYEVDPKSVNQVDLKLVHGYKQSTEFLREFLLNNQPEKVLHIVDKDVGFDFSWIFELLQNTKGKIQLELVHKPKRRIDDWEEYKYEIRESLTHLPDHWPCDKVLYYHYHDHKGHGIYEHSTRIPIKPAGGWEIYRSDWCPVIDSPLRPFSQESIDSLKGQEEASDVVSRCQRNWKDEPVPKSDIDIIVNTAMNMPTKQNVLMYELFVFTGRDEIDFLYDISTPPGVNTDQKWRNAQIRAPLVLAWFIAKDVRDTVHSEIPEDEVYSFSTTSHEARNLNVGISCGAAALTAGQLGYHTGFNCCFQLDKLEVLAQHKRPGIGSFVLSLGVGKPVDGVPRNHIFANDHIDKTLIIKTEPKKDKIIHYF
tara:strand:- start:181 stop:1380 length:1200 start_codon:yes stop_codon:yes gene_type:complete